MTTPPPLTTGAAAWSGSQIAMLRHLQAALAHRATARDDRAEATLLAQSIGRAGLVAPRTLSELVHQDLVVGVDQSAEQRLGDDGVGNSGYQSLGARSLVRISGLAVMARSETRS